MTNVYAYKLIKTYRQQLNLSQEKLAQKAGLSHMTILKLERGIQKNPGVQTLQRIAKALKVKLQDFFV